MNNRLSLHGCMAYWRETLISRLPVEKPWLSERPTRSRQSGGQTGRSLHELPHVATNRQELMRIHTPDDVADDRRHDPHDTAHSEVR